MREISWGLSVAFCLLLTGCGSSFEYTPPALSGAKWQASNVAVVVEDARAAAVSTPPKVPTITMGGGGQDADMRLPPEFTEFVSWRLTQLISRNGPRLRLVIIPESVRAGWSASLWAETEKADVTLRFRILSEDGSRVLLEGTGKGRQEFSSTDASDEELARVFRAACNDAFDAFFASGATIQRLNQPLNQATPASAPVAALAH